MPPVEIRVQGRIDEHWSDWFDDLTITHTDGYAVEPTRTASLLIGMGERYDAIVTLGDGVFALVAEPMGKEGLARALVRTGSGAPWPDSVGGWDLGWLPGLPSSSKYAPFQLAVACWSACSRTCDRSGIKTIISRSIVSESDCCS